MVCTCRKGQGIAIQAIRVFLNVAYNKICFHKGRELDRALLNI